MKSSADFGFFGHSIATAPDVNVLSLQQLQEYETRYQTVADTEDGGEICYIKLFNVGQKVPETFPAHLLRTTRHVMHDLAHLTSESSMNHRDDVVSCGVTKW